jgi:hypothetical protein
VTPEHLRSAAKVFDGLHDSIDRMPHLFADIAAQKFAGTPLATALPQANEAGTQAKTVIKGRLHRISELLRTSADGYEGVDTGLADQLDAIGEMNAGVRAQPGTADGPAPAIAAQPGETRT